MFIKITRIGVTKGSKDVPVGEIVETDESSARSLIADGYAEEVAETVAKNALKSPVSPSGLSGDKLPDQDQDDAAGGQQQADSGKNNDTEPDPEKIKKALNTQYTRDDLYEAAKAAGVEIAYDAKKAEIVEAVIDQGKAAALLK